MTTISKTIQETERRAQALLADLIPLVHDERVAQDPEFICLLERALNQAELQLASARAETGDVSEVRPRESPPAAEKPRETPAA